MLANLAGELPAEPGWRYEPKRDGSRAVLTRGGGTARLWSRQRNDLTDGFRDIAAAAVSQLPDDVVLDGVI